LPEAFYTWHATFRAAQEMLDDNRPPMSLARICPSLSGEAVAGRILGRYTQRLSSARDSGAWPLLPNVWGGLPAGVAGVKVPAKYFLRRELDLRHCSATPPLGCLRAQQLFHLKQSTISAGHGAVKMGRLLWEYEAVPSPFGRTYTLRIGLQGAERAGRSLVSPKPEQPGRGHRSASRLSWELPPVFVFTEHGPVG